MARFMDHELRNETEFKPHYETLKNAKSTAEASEALRRYIKYVPNAPVNTFDPEFRVKNNRNWALWAKNLGLAQDGPESNEDPAAGIKALVGRLNTGGAKSPSKAPASTGQDDAAQAIRTLTAKFGKGQPARPERALPIGQTTAWLTGKTPPVTEIPANPMAQRTYESLIKNGFADTEELRRKFVSGYAAVVSGKQSSIFTEEDNALIAAARNGQIDPTRGVAPAAEPLSIETLGGLQGGANMPPVSPVTSPTSNEVMQQEPLPAQPSHRP